ncbi:hypothetical protein [Mesorhizobium sp. L48C026A00]|uniref:hypothetical protein n=1 Tax=Mesorhizobium sp. L48C026A00 TaxID=1287182 RepID=UPI0004CF901C|nr:hypothetical protein [Mesorhizobium sp. L48C026A00]
MTRNIPAGEGALNRMLYSNPEVDQQITAAYLEMDQTKRVGHAVEAMQMVTDDAVVLPIVFVASQWASHAPVGKVAANPRGRTSARLVKKA